MNQNVELSEWVATWVTSQIKWCFSPSTILDLETITGRIENVVVFYILVISLHYFFSPVAVLFNLYYVILTDSST